MLPPWRRSCFAAAASVERPASSRAPGARCLQLFLPPVLAPAMDGLVVPQQLPWPLAVALLVLGGGTASTWSHWAARAAADPFVRAAAAGGLARASEAAAAMGASSTGSWAFVGAGAFAGLLLALAAGCACGGACLGGVWYWTRARDRAPTANSDLDALAWEIYAGGRQGQALRAASLRLRACDTELWNWAAYRAQRAPISFQERRR